MMQETDFIDRWAAYVAPDDTSTKRVRISSKWRHDLGSCRHDAPKAHQEPPSGERNLNTPLQQAQALALPHQFESRMVTPTVHSALDAVGFLSRIGAALPSSPLQFTRQPRM